MKRKFGFCLIALGVLVGAGVGVYSNVALYSGNPYALPTALIGGAIANSLCAIGWFIL